MRLERYEQVQRILAQRRAKKVEDRADNLLDILVKGVASKGTGVAFDCPLCDAITAKAFRLAEAFQVEVDKRRTAADVGENQS